MISGGQKKDKACLNLACVTWRFEKQFERKRTQHDCLKTARLCKLLWILNESRKGEFQWRRFTFDKNLCRNNCSHKKYMMSRGLWSFFITAFAIDPILNLTASYVSLRIDWQFGPHGISRGTLIGWSAATRFWVAEIGGNQVGKVFRPAGSVRWVLNERDEGLFRKSTVTPKHCIPRLVRGIRKWQYEILSEQK